VRVHLDVGNSQQARERFVNLDGDLGMPGVETPHPDLEFRRLAEDPLVVIVSPAHAWARRRSVSLADLSSERLILREPGSSSRQLIERRLVTLGLRIQPAMEIASNEVIKRVWRWATA
jgi:DNA-binding transcriptional LysR family regulator